MHRMMSPPSSTRASLSATCRRCGLKAPENLLLKAEGISVVGVQRHGGKAPGHPNLSRGLAVSEVGRASCRANLKLVGV